MDGGQYLVMGNSWALSDRLWLPWATFYSVENQNPPIAVWADGKWETRNAPANWDYECLMKMGKDIYKVKVDQQWNLCPVATKFDNKLNFKDWSDAREQVLFANNASCMRYLYNKLPNEIKKSDCKILWNSKFQDYTITSYWKTLTIEPMEIAWDWITKDLSRCLAFLNLTNYLRALWDQHGRKDPDVNRDLWVRWIRINGKKVSIDKDSFWLKDATPKELDDFRRDNNREYFYDKWDRKWKNKNYTKIILQ